MPSNGPCQMRPSPPPPQFCGALLTLPLPQVKVHHGCLLRCCCFSHMCICACCVLVLLTLSHVLQDSMFTSPTVTATQDSAIRFGVQLMVRYGCSISLFDNEHFHVKRMTSMLAKV